MSKIEVAATPTAANKQVFVNPENEIVLKPGTLLPVAACCGDGKLRSRVGLKNAADRPSKRESRRETSCH